MFTIKKITRTNPIAWDNFVKKANNGTMFHLRKFLSYHPEHRFVDHSLEFYKRHKLFSVFPSAELKLFITADINIRAERRYKELKANNQSVSKKSV